MLEPHTRFSNDNRMRNQAIPIPRNQSSSRHHNHHSGSDTMKVTKNRTISSPSVWVKLLVMLLVVLSHEWYGCFSFAPPLALCRTVARRNSLFGGDNNHIVAAAASQPEVTTSGAFAKDDDGRSDEIIDNIVEYYTQKEIIGQEPMAEDDDDEDLVSRSGNRKRGNIQLVAGSGKTYIAWKAMERILLRDQEGTPNSRPSSIGLYVTPFLNLVGQALDNRDDHGIMTKTNPDGTDAFQTMIVASKSSRKREPCTTDVEEILAFLRDDAAAGSGGPPPSKILVCTYNSLPRIGSAIARMNHPSPDDPDRDESDPPVAVDFAVFDEAHKMEGLKRSIHKNDSTRRFNYGLFDSNIDIRNRLFMTGTPQNYTQTVEVMSCLPSQTRADGTRRFLRRFGDSSMLEVETTPKILGFSDETVFGPCLAQKTYRQSVEENITLPISLYAVDSAFIREFGTSESIVSEKDYFLPLAILSAFNKLKVKHAVTFHSTNQRARDFLGVMKDVVGTKGEEEEAIEFFTMDHTMTPSRRSQVLQEAQTAPRSLITNCKLLSMGVDNASWDLVVIADPVYSSVDGRQMIGRVGRKAPGKERGYVLVPMPIEEDLTEGMNNGVYELFVSTFQHMVSLNPELRKDVLFVIEKSKEIRRPLGQNDFPDRVLEAFVFPTTMPLKLQTKLMDRAIIEYDRTERSNDLLRRWEEMFALLLKYKEREGDCNVRTRHQEDGKNLGVWLSNQRFQKKQGTLDKTLEDRLTSVGFSWNLPAQRWEEMFALLLKYKEREGDCNVPNRHQEDGKNLGSWLFKLRYDKRKGTLDKTQEEKLTNAGVVWDPIPHRWEEMFALLLKYKEREGDCHVSQGHQEDGEALGDWLDRQRNRKKQDKLDKTQEERLTNVGVVWGVIEQRGEEMFALLLQYKEREGDCDVPQSHQEDGRNLGFWLSNQRSKKKKGTLDKTLEEKLTNAGVVWNFSEHRLQRWEEMFALLLEYKDREGNCNIPPKYSEDGQNLGHWLSSQRARKRQGILDKTREERLTNAGVSWDALQQKWEIMFALLLKYKDREGNCNIPPKYSEDGQNLGLWLSSQRARKKQGTLDKTREERLTNAGVVWDATQQKWEAMFALLLEYKDREGDCNVPRHYQEDGQSLGSWLSRQRLYKRQGTLEKTQEERLANAGVHWGAKQQKWEKMFALLLKYKEREGDCNVPKEYQEDGRNLGFWLSGQRFQKKQGTLNKIREEKLTNAGVVWYYMEYRWDEMFALLLEYKDREGNCNVPPKYSEDGQSLGSWLSNQRFKKRQGTLEKTQEERLANAGVHWGAKQQKWEAMFALLLKYKDREGDCNVPIDYQEDGQNLGFWFSNQRSKKKQGTLDKTLEEKFTNAGVNWGFMDQKWEAMFALLLKYKEREGDCKVSTKHQEDGKNLGTWLSKQRTRKKQGTLDKTREERLTNAGVVWGAMEQYWEAMFALLLKYKEREGDCKVRTKHKEDGQNLGSWLSNQRFLKKQGTLDKTREERLTNAGAL